MTPIPGVAPAAGTTAPPDAGRALDLALAARLGIRVHYPEWDTEREHPQYVPSGKPYRTHHRDAVPLPRFSERFGDAWMLVEHIRALGWGFVVTADPGETGRCHVAFDQAVGGEAVATADTMPLGVCRAALLALPEPPSRRRRPAEKATP